jgi:hypothetical protein
VRAERHGSRWRGVPLKPDNLADHLRVLDANELVCSLSLNPNSARWDCRCERRFTGGPEAPERFGDAVDALEDSQLFVLDESGRALGAPVHPPVELELARGRGTHYRIVGAYPRSVAEAQRLFGLDRAPFAWQGLMNRYACKQVRLEIRGGGTGALRGAFASETDLGTGLQQPLPLGAGSTDDRVVIDYPDCPPRLLIRVYWPLQLG